MELEQRFNPKHPHWSSSLSSRPLGREEYWLQWMRPQKWVREGEFPPGSAFLLLGRTGCIIPHIQIRDFGCGLGKSRVRLRADRERGKGQQKPQEKHQAFPGMQAGATLTRKECNRGILSIQIFPENQAMHPKNPTRSESPHSCKNKHEE